MLVKDVLGQINKTGDAYGSNNGGRQKRVMLEYSNANTHKEYHVGHLRNICYGDAVYKILAANGYEAIPVSYINDFGIHAAKTLWAFQEYYDNKAPAKGKGRFLGKAYARAAKELEENKIGKKLVEALMKKIESRQGEEYKLWQKTRQWSIDQFNAIYQELGVTFKNIYYESELIREGRAEVDKLIKKGILKKSEGAIIADLEKKDLSVLVVLRSDGTATYPVADIALAKAKAKEFKPDASIYVVDVRQTLYFKQLFEILKQAGHKEKMIHLAYDFVKLPDGMMSSRTGNIITYEDLREQVLARAKAETSKRHKNWSEKKISHVAEALAIGALKFEMLKAGADQTIAFDINKALRFDGFTAAYLQYTYARINSIIRKTKKQKNKKTKIIFSALTENREHGLVLQLAKYPDTVKKAGENYDPSEAAKYLFSLAQEFNDYYHQVPVLKAEKEIREARLGLIMAVSQIIQNGLKLLGIEVVEEM